MCTRSNCLEIVAKIKVSTESRIGERLRLLKSSQSQNTLSILNLAVENKKYTPADYILEYLNLFGLTNFPLA